MVACRGVAALVARQPDGCSASEDSGYTFTPRCLVVTCTADLPAFALPAECVVPGQVAEGHAWL